MVCGVGAPKDATLYQATRAATYVALGDHDPLAAGGRLIIPALLSEGAGSGAGERRFYRRLRDADDAQTLYESMKTGYEPGAQRAFVLARVLCEYDIFVTNSLTPDVVETCLLRTADDVTAPLEPGSRVLVLPDAIHTLLVSPASHPES